MSIALTERDPRSLLKMFSLIVGCSVVAGSAALDLHCNSDLQQGTCAGVGQDETSMDLSAAAEDTSLLQSWQTKNPLTLEAAAQQDEGPVRGRHGAEGDRKLDHDMSSFQTSAEAWFHGGGRVLPSSPAALSVLETFRVHGNSSTVTWSVFAAAAILVGAAVFWASSGSATALEGEDITADRWWLIVMSGVVQMVAGSVYAMGAWQDALRDALGTTMDGISLIGAATFAGSLLAMLGGYAFDKLGPKAAVTLGGTLCTLGYLLIGIAVVSADLLTQPVKMSLAATGAMLAGYSSVSLLDNVVCMACSLSFPDNRAAVVGYLKAVLATAAGLWALLWVHVFKAPHGPGLPAYIGFVASVALGATIFSLGGLRILPAGPSRQAFKEADNSRLGTLIFFLVTLSFYDVGVSFFYSRGILMPTSALGYVGIGLGLLPLTLLQARSEEQKPAEQLEPKTLLAPGPQSEGVTFATAILGLDFWLIWLMQFAVFGAGVATNQNLALILESAGSPSASGLGVALFALTSSLSRIAVGILSDKYSHVISRFNWLTLVSACAVAAQFLVSIMSFGAIMLGTLLMGLSFGAFFTVIVPVVNEMYGKKQFGIIMGAQLASQAAAAFLICLKMLPTIYKNATPPGQTSCHGESCYRMSFLLLTGINGAGLVAALWLQQRNKDSMPMDRLA
ncbi:unnamed protein product [Polarella glacialis]|uniref:Major facilitator superfamily (MFS) profile domain-containing protein n=1 Tax=Polarella glacialis TaxID=89957 RepID=A0A813I0J6_POLGL|nr:unnamed protein product [Polarella glacialis]